MNIGNLDYWLTQPLSSFNSIQERAYRELNDPREFGEREYFAQRYSAFFVPPVTSLYTFAIISDDNSRLYISPTANAEDMELVAYAVQNSRRQWDWFDSQTSEPMMMERGRYYYMEAYSYQGPGISPTLFVHSSQKATTNTTHQGTDLTGSTICFSQVTGTWESVPRSILYPTPPTLTRETERCRES